MAKNFFAPVLLSGLEDKKKGTVELHITSDRLISMPATVSWFVTDVAGKRLAAGNKKTRTPVNGNRRIETLKLRKLLDAQGENNLVVWLEMKVPSEPLQRNVVLFARPKQMDLSQAPDITCAVKANRDGSFMLTLKSRKVALWTWVELTGIDARLSNNFVHLRPGMIEKILVLPCCMLTAVELRKQLVVRSLVDTY